MNRSGVAHGGPERDEMCLAGQSRPNDADPPRLAVSRLTNIAPPSSSARTRSSDRNHPAPPPPSPNPATGQADAIASAHVVADTILDLNGLYRADFDEIREFHPDLAIEMHKNVSRIAAMFGSERRCDTQPPFAGGLPALT